MSLPRQQKIFLAALPLTALLRPLGGPQYRCRRHARHLQREAAQRLARQLLRAATDAEDGTWIVCAEASGRPRVTGPDGRSGPDISMSHCADGVACALVLEGSVGVDIESVRAGRSHGEIAKTYLSPEERRWVVRHGEAAFLASWTMREAVAKAAGTGLAGALSVEGSWTPDAANGTHLVDIGGQSWVIGHRGRAATHMAIAWRPTRAADSVREEAAGALDRAAANLS